MKQRPGCLTSGQGLRYWEPVTLPTFFRSSQETLVADCPWNTFSLFAERVFDCFGDTGRWVVSCSAQRCGVGPGCGGRAEKGIC